MYSKRERYFKKGTLLTEKKILKMKGNQTGIKQPLMIESGRDNFGKFIYQFPPETKTFIRKLDRILDRLYRQNLSLIFNEPCLKERLLRNYTHTHTHTHIYIYIYIYIYIQISLNIIDIFCLHIFLLILSYCRIDFIVFGLN